MRCIKSVMKVKAEGSRRMTTNVIIGLRGVVLVVCQVSNHTTTHEYHSHAEYSAVINRERVLSPECDVFDDAIREDR